MPPISENDLVLPALMLLDGSPDGLTTSNLIAELKDLLHPSGDDLAILSGRSDTKFSQKVRNLKSHNTLVKRGFATLEEGGRNRPYRITVAGRSYYLQHKDSLDALTDFPLRHTENDLKRLASGKPVVVLDDYLVREGQLRARTVEYRSRSQLLRAKAVEFYTRCGSIACQACRFEFEQAYGAIGEGYIQIHHLRPVSFLSGEPMNLQRALRNVRPLCANCHQMVHTRTPPLPIDTLRKRLRVSYSYA